MRKKLWDEKKTFNRIKIGNEKKLTEKKVFIKEISYDARIFEAAFGLIKFIPGDQAC